MLIAVIAVLLIIITTTLREQIGPGYMGVALSSVLSFSGIVKGVLASWVMLEVAISAVSRIRTFASSTAREADPDEELSEPPDREWPSSGAVELRGVTASYPYVAVGVGLVSETTDLGYTVQLESFCMT
jgi:ABC-type multidrug transport system fused ATPase/permease subunit